MKSITLSDGITKIPAKNKVYRNISKFDSSIYSVIDTNVVYEQFNQNYNIVQRKDNHVETEFYGVYVFYPNGKFNYFVINRKDSLGMNSFNTNYKGRRGVYYKEKGEIRYDLFAESNELGWLGELNGTLTVKGDTLYVNRDESSRYIDIYIKRNLPVEYSKYIKSW